MSRFVAALLLYNHIVEAKLLLFSHKIKYFTNYFLHGGLIH